ncbi:DUF1330 domain-containing protein [Zwartia sp.]|uniref:DUF1330 domain-containing protein n=1 Tax=Zwartia sp. TaxID=2978004 RepID=UPI00271FAE34|nr:DUF1330 domain-containing protein [Zwartia sp.]MDO9026215.1 DUF1330 domain-containing protein [Zwartia sp.]
MSKDKGYVFVELDVHDMDNFKAHYQPRSTAAVAAFNGRFVMRGGEVSVKNGPTDSRRRVLLEFERYEDALAFYDSPQYQEAKLHRDKYAHVHTFYIMRGT